MSCYQLIITITFSHKREILIEQKEVLIVILIVMIKIWRIACKMAVKFLSKQ